MKASLRGWLPGALTLLGLTLAACSSLLDVKTPDIIKPGDVNNPDGAVAAYTGAIGDFTFANDGDNGATEGQILVSGVMTDEYTDVETFPTRIEYDSRAINENNGTLNGVFFNLQKARVAAEGSIPPLRQYAPTPTSRIGEMFALAGFTYIYFAENYCSGVPFSERNPDGSLLYGIPQTTTQILDRAISRFDSALAATADVSVQSLAKVGKARALLDEGQFAAAAAATAGVVDTFKYQTGHSQATNRQWNGVFVFNNQATAGTARFSVADLEGTNGLNFRSSGDPRTRDTLAKKGFDGVSPLFVLTKYASAVSPVRVADGLEARLIRAEAVLQGGNGAGMVDSLNALRADSLKTGIKGLAPLADPGTQVGREDLLFRERAFWLFATGHRLGDLRRMTRAPYNRAVTSIYPVGVYLHANTVYGANTELPVPQSERNNPNYTGCNYNTP
jgi:hypothetical protein